MNRRDFLIGAASGATTTVVLGAAGRALPESLARSADGALPPVPTPEPPSNLYQGRRSFAQQGEDLILYNLLCHALRIPSPSYLDVGAGDPVLSNNTYALYLAGSRGVLVEPNPALVRKLRATRPGDVVVGCGVGVTGDSVADYYVIRGRWPLNTFSGEAVAEYRRQSAADPVERILRMPLISINRLMADHFGSAPDLLSIDIEGLDLAVLHTMDFRAHRPAAICAETKKPGASHDGTPIARFLRRKGYVACAGSLYNTIFVDRSRIG
jgi:FkbM family methyltransferase